MYYIVFFSLLVQVSYTTQAKQIFGVLCGGGSGSGSTVGIATAYGLDGPGIESWWGEIFHTCPDRARPPTLLYNGYRVFPGGKVLPGRDAEPSPPSSVEVKNRVLSLRAFVAYERVKPTYF